MRVTSEDAAEGGRATAERLCYYCNEGRCALCTGSDRTVMNGRIVEIPCAHGCREQQRKPNAKAAPQTLRQRRA